MAFLSIINETENTFINIVYNYDTALFQNETFIYLLNYTNYKNGKNIVCKIFRRQPKNKSIGYVNNRQRTRL